MRILLSVLILAMVVGHIFSIEMGLGAGLSVKNAILYVGAISIVFRIVVDRNFKMEMGRFVATYLALIGYAVLTWLIIGLGAFYKSYEMGASGIILKVSLIDPLIFFLTFFFGIRTNDDAIKILKLLALACVLINIANLGAAFHFLPLDYEAGDSGRMSGPLGEPNQYGDYIVMFLPLLCVIAMSSRGFVKLFWVLGIMVSVGSLLTTASRAAFVALIVSGLWGSYMLRSYLSIRSVVKVFSWGVAVSLLVGAVVSIQFADLLRERFIGQTKAAGFGELSSGRTDFWGDVIDKLMSQPIAMITGFGWNSYSSMGFFFSAHSYYLAQWFNLGIPGLTLGILSFALLIRETRSSLPVAPPLEKSHLMAFTFSIISLLTAILFGEIYSPWPFFWAYAGTCMRLAANSRAAADARTGGEASRPKTSGRVMQMR